MTTKTLEQEFEDWKKQHRGACTMATSNPIAALQDAFVDGYEAGHAAAIRHALSSIAKALSPEPA